MSRARLFTENMLVYGLGGVLAKLVPFLMLPVVTRLMPGTEFFGLSDLTNTVVSFAQALAVMGMYDAMFRMFFEEDDDDYKREICSSALFFVVGSSLIISICLVVLTDPISRVFFGSSAYSSLVAVAAVSTFTGSCNIIAQAPTRMQNKRIVFIAMNLLTAVLSYAISIPMLLAGEYLLALPLSAALATALALMVFTFLNRRWFKPRLIRMVHIKAMLAIGLPLVPTFLAYWVFNSCDRVMIVNFLGTDEAGIYASASKVGQISQLIYTAFAQGWQYFAFSTMKDDDQVELNSRVFEYLGVISFLGTALLTAVSKLLFLIMFPTDYANGALCAPYLFLSPLLLMLFQVSANQLLIIRKTWPMALLLALGVAANIGGNLILIPLMGIEGAAISTLLGYVVTNAVTLIILTHMRLMAVGPRFFMVVGLYVVFFVIWRLLLVDNLIMPFVAVVVLFALSAVIYNQELMRAVHKLLSHGNGEESKEQ